MRQNWLILTIVAITVSCTTYDSENYLNEEKIALQNLIPEMIGYESVLMDSVAETPSVYINSELDNELKITNTQYEELSDVDKEPLAILVKGKLSKRILPKDTFNDTLELNVKLVSGNEYQSLQLDKNAKLTKHLSISRILFTPDFKKGYLTYETQCNKMCGSNSILSIKKMDAHWTIDEFWEWPTVSPM